MMTVLMLLLFVTSTYAKEQRPFVQAPIENLDTFYTFSPPNSSAFRTLTLSNDFNILHIGGISKVFGQRADDIRRASYSSVSWDATEEQRKNCAIQSGVHGEKCYNMIQIIHQINSSHILICGSNAYNPQNKILHRENEDQRFVLAKDRMTKGSLCSCDPNDSITSLMIPDENGARFFATQRIDVNSEISFIKSMPTNIVFAAKKTQKDIVSSFSANDVVMDQDMKKVYFVSDEEVVKSSYAPTITQVCANDIGGTNVLKSRWTSLLKVHLLCQTGDDFPLVFDKVTDMTMGSDQILYGTFTTRHETSRANAVCAFRLADIQKAFNERKIYEGGDTSKIAEIPKSDTLRPGICAYSGMIPDNKAASTSKNFPKPHLLFMLNNYLVVGSVNAAYGPDSTMQNPLLIKGGEKFTKIAVEQVTSVDGTSFDVVFVGKEDGSVYKFVALPKGDKVETLELAHYQPSTNPILSMKLSQELGNIYIGTDKGVHQISTSNCAAYTKSCNFCDPCRMCVLSRDPGCAWDMEAKMCVSIRGRRKQNLIQDVIHGDASAQCGDLTAPRVVLKKVNNGHTEMFGNIVKNPNVVYTWYIDGSEGQIYGKPGKHRITPDGQLEISNFSSDDIATYKCNYTVNSCLVTAAVFDFEGSTDIPPIVSVSSESNVVGTITPPLTATNGPPIIPTSHASSTTSATPLAQSQVQIGLIIGILLLVLLIVVVVLVHKCKKKKTYSPTKGEESSKNMAAMEFSASPMTTQDNRTENNNINRIRYESEYDTRLGRPLLESQGHQMTVDDVPETQQDSLPAPSHAKRNTKSLDDLNDVDSIGYIDDDDGAASDEHPIQKPSGSVREKTGRKRVPPARTKSMPGSEFYVVFGGKKVKCSTLQRNKDGNWMIQVRPNQSALQSFEKDEIIDILDDSETLDSSTRNRQLFEETPNTKSSAALQNAENRRAFFEADSSKASADRSHIVQYMTSTPNSMSTKPFSVGDGTKQPLTEQHSQASLRSLGQNSSEDRDSDTTVQGSSMTLQHEDTPSILLQKSQTTTKSAERQNSFAAVPNFQNTSNVPATSSTNKTRKHKSVRNNDSYHSSNKSLDRSSGSSDGDEQLHGRDKNVSRKCKKPMDSPSKESRTSQGSSSSGDYRSARSSMISEQSHDHR